MDIIISWNNEKKKIKLPINPSAISMSGTMNNTSLYIHNKGEVNLKGKRGLYELTIESFFPARKYEFANGAYHKPYDYYCRNLKFLFENNKTIHVIVTGTDINLFCTIESFTHGEADRTGDVQYSLALKEYRPIVSTKAKKRVTTKDSKASYKWNEGDTWSKVCKKKLGTSKDWKKVRKKNLAVIKKAKKKHPKKKEAVALIGYKVVIKS